MSGHQHSEAWDSGFLQVDDLHNLHYEQYGPRDGKPGWFSSLNLPALRLRTQLSGRPTRRAGWTNLQEHDRVL
jgi:hypothetical protein